MQARQETPTFPAAAAGGGARWPSLSVVMPVRDEGAHLRAAAQAVLAQDYSGPLEVVLAVGPSHDDTADVARRLAAADARVRVVDNPSGRTPAGLNLAIAASVGTVVARVDGHAALSPGYLRRAVELLADTGAVNVGGIMAAQGRTPFERAVAAAMTSRFGVGDAKFHYGGVAGPVDTVYLGVFRRDALARVGGFDEAFLRTQDAELNHRLRAAGGTVWFSPELSVTYRPRDTLPALARQYFEYGRYRRAVVRRHPGSLRWRQVVAPAALTANVAGVVAAAARHPAGLAAPGAYLTAVGAASALTARRMPAGGAPWLPAVFVTMHMSWAAGFVSSPRRLVG